MFDVVVGELEPLGLSAVARRHVCARDDVQSLKFRARISHVPAHRRIGPGLIAVAEEPQVQIDEPRDRIDGVVVEPQLAQPLLSEFCTHHIVVSESDLALLKATSFGLADVVHDGGEPERHIRRVR